MGWYHLTQLVKMPNVCMKAVVEPWYLGAGGSAPGATEFMEMKAEYEAKGVAFYPASHTGQRAVRLVGKLVPNLVVPPGMIDDLLGDARGVARWKWRGFHPI